MSLLFCTLSERIPHACGTYSGRMWNTFGALVEQTPLADCSGFD